MASENGAPLDSVSMEEETSTLLSLGVGSLLSNGSVVEANNTSDEDWLRKEYVIRIVVPTVYGIIFLLGLIGNTLVILVVAMDKQMRSTTNVLILMLAVADLLFIVFCVPFTAASYAMPVWPFGDIWCKIVQYLIYVCAYFSVYTLVLMSLDRYLAVVHAIRSMRFRNERNTWLAVCIIWAVISLAHVPMLLDTDIFSYDFGGQSRSTCTNMRHIHDKHWEIVFHATFLSFGYILPLGAVCVMYGLMLKRLHGAAPGGVSKSQESMRAKRRVTKMVVIIVVVFALCWLPQQFMFLMEKICSYRPTSMAWISFIFLSNSLAYMNSCVNPIFYAFLSENFRRSFKKILCCKSPATRRSEYELVSVKQSEAVTQATAT